ncbi:unnamed protein product [Tilletia controversa]|uniref:TEA domain-containing protein n=3 Tax=Tilletia TaxID=13289 RepID=A0A8X7SZY5_9BASI|nr:hypothetical protein CF336_g941 [Tilletia laevis]KAE8204399.1 hypothetical protein CF328_g1111 [Tilletia controversa]KAE8264537.1 hypothetical protein A4X03_0g876 [Tilletia caries]KAE8207681.1 hypothetical protein CF335_g969 [Tilletia laevis]KAE8253795.1 hypothetical protein A4X06_0g1216 [Tilletia controversa]
MNGMSRSLSLNSALYPSPTGSNNSLPDSALQTPDGVHSALPQEHSTMAHMFMSKSGQMFNHNGEQMMSAQNGMLLGPPATFTSNLAAAMDFNSVSFLGKRQMQGNPDPSIFRHSIQPLLPSEGSSGSLSSMDDYADESRGASGFDISAFSNQTTDFLMSPPRMTVHLPESTPASAMTEEAKRRKYSAVHQTPLQFSSSTSTDSIGSASSHAFMNAPFGADPFVRQTQQTPQKEQSASQPWMNMQDRAAFFYSVTETPSDLSGSACSSQPSSVASSYASKRRVSLAADGSSDIASLTMGLTIPSVHDDGPKSAPPTANPYAMQQAAEEAFGADYDVCDSPGRSGSTDQAPESPDLSKNKAAGNVWPDNVEVAFWEALRLIPKLGRRKVLVGGKACGRNELIADYIQRKTGVKRSRKQVSSHIQVLKNIKKNDIEFQQLIAEPKSDDEYYIPAGGMMYAQTLAGYGYGGLGGQYPLLEMDGIALLSPYTPGMGSTAGIDMMAPPLSATGGLTTAMNGMTFPQTGEVKMMSCTTFPILPSSFTMWLQCSQTSSRHDYVSMDRKKMASCAQGKSGLPTMPIENIRVGHLRFPMLAEMYQRLPCQFLHVHVPLHVPRYDVANPRFDQFSAQLSLVSATDARLTSVTTIYSHGKRVLSLVEPLDPPRKIISRSGSESASGANSPGGEVPMTATTSSTEGSLASSKHSFVHQAPFATDFWADFLSRTHPAHIEKSIPPAFGKDPCERAALGMAISGITLVQEFVVASEEAINNLGGVEAILGGATSNTFDSSANVSAGSKIGDVVLVVAWDLECVEALEGPGSTSVSVLTMATRSPSPLRKIAPLPTGSPVRSGQNLMVPGSNYFSLQKQQSMNMSTYSNIPSGSVSESSSQGSMSISISEPTSISSQGHSQPQMQMPTLLRKRGISVSKPNLMVQIPPAPAHLSMHKNVLHAQAAMRAGGSASPGLASATMAAAHFGMVQQSGAHTPITPFPQLIHTPDLPPPMLPNVEEAAFQRERLERHWATTQPPSDMISPLNGTFGLEAHGMPMAASSQMMLLRGNSLSSTLAGAADVQSDSMSSIASTPDVFSASFGISAFGGGMHRPSIVAAAPPCSRSLSTGALGLDLGVSHSLGRAHEIDGQMIRGFSSGAVEAHQQSASDYSNSGSHDLFEGILAALGASPGGMTGPMDDGDGC